jgi:two-component sensor histidine kinase
MKQTADALRSITPTLVLYVVLFSLVMSLVLTVFTLYLDYRQELATVVLVSHMISTLFVAGFIYLLIRSKVTRHLSAIAAYAQDLNPDQPDRKLELQRSQTGVDELETVVTAVNSMRTRLLQDIRERNLLDGQLQQYKEKLEELAAERTRELIATNKNLKLEIAERRHAEELLTTSQKQLQSSLKEKETLLQEIHHRVKNNMQVISSLLFLQANDINNEQIKAALQESQSRIYTMSVAHELLYRSNNLSEITVKTYLTKVTASLLQMYKVPSEKISLRIEADDTLLSIQKASTLGLIINELVSNSLKHAFPGDSTGEIDLDFKKTGANSVQVVVKDNGIGLPSGFDWRKSKSLGLQLVQTLTENQLDGSIDLANGSGATFLIRFDLDQPI